MTFLLLATALVAATVFVVRPAVAEGPRFTPVHFDGRGVLLAFAGLIAAALLVGVEAALALMVAWLVKELGHALGYRLAGHDSARFRLLPLPDRSAPPASDLAGFFVLLMGPGLGLAPMVLAFALGTVLAPSAPELAHVARSYALASGALNFIALLPVWPLAGGRMVRMVIEARFPQVDRLGAAVLSTFLIGLALPLQSGLLLLFGLVGALALAMRPAAAAAKRPRLTRSQLRIGFTAYVATLSAYFLGGWWVLSLIPFSL